MSVIPPANMRLELPTLSKRDAKAIERVRQLWAVKDSRTGAAQLASSLLRTAMSDKVYTARAAHIRNMGIAL